MSKLKGAACDRLEILSSPRPPSPLPKSSARYSDYKQKDDRTEGCDNDETDKAALNMKADARQDPRPDESADNPDGNIANQTKAAGRNNFSGEPACDQACQQNGQEPFT